jgi:hypothetical protein
MKKLLLALLLLPTLSFGQIIVNNQDINKLPDLAYIELIIDRRLLANQQVFAAIDYGQIMQWGTIRQHRIQGDTGTDRRFNTEIEIFNFLFKNGWKHETTYATDDRIYHIFRRKEQAKN